MCALTPSSNCYPTNPLPRNHPESPRYNVFDDVHPLWVDRVRWIILRLASYTSNASSCMFSPSSSRLILTHQEIRTEDPLVTSFLLGDPGLEAPRISFYQSFIILSSALTQLKPNYPRYIPGMPASLSVVVDPPKSRHLPSSQSSKAVRFLPIACLLLLLPPLSHHQSIQDQYSLASFSLVQFEFMLITQPKLPNTLPSSKCQNKVMA